MADKKEKNSKWGVDKKIGLGTGINFLQLITIVWLGSAFYTQVNANQTKTDERFAAYDKQREISSQREEKLQEGLTQVMMTLTGITERMNTTTDAVKEVRDEIKNQNQNHSGK